MNKLVKTLHILSWIPIFLIKLGLVILGLFFIPLFLINRDQKKYELDGRYFSSMWGLWDNVEEGCPEWWLKMDKPWYKDLFPRWWWFAIRNPVNGFRFIFKDVEWKSVNVEGWPNRQMEAQDLLDHEIKSISRWTYKGPFAGYRKIWLTKPGKYSEVWFGWKVGSDVPGLGFTTQIRRNRDIGK